MTDQEQEDLDEAVHEAKATEAAEINNSGPDAQREYLGIGTRESDLIGSTIENAALCFAFGSQDA